MLTYLAFMLPGLLLSLWASYKVKATFRKYSEVPARSGKSGAQAARELLQREGLGNVQVEEVPGFLSDHYDPTAKVLRLSPDVYRGRSLASLGVAAHEAGHALQDKADYAPMRMRSLIVKPAQIGSNIGIWLSIGGFFINSVQLVWLGIILFSAAVLFTLVTLPVEFDASKRAVAKLQQFGIVSGSGETEGAKAVLNAAALTYVAGAVSAIMQLMYFVLQATAMNDD